MIGMCISGGNISENSAILKVTVPTGSTVIMTKGGIILTSTMWIQDKDNTLDCAVFFIGPGLFDAVNAWTVSASFNGITKSRTILISSAKQYELAFLSHVPTEYQEVEYIVGTGTQYIDSGIVLTGADFEIETNYFMCTTLVNGEQSIFSNWNSAVNNWNLFVNSSSNFDLYINGHYTYSMTIARIYSLIKVSKSGDVWTFQEDSSTHTITKAQTFSNLSIKFFARGDTNNRLHGRIGGVKITNGGAPFGEFYPCYRKSDSVVGMWDNVTNTFFTNAGSGSFTAGPDV